MPTRSLHARGAVAPGDRAEWQSWVAKQRFAQPAPAAATAGGRMGMRAAQRERPRRDAGSGPLHRDADAQPARPMAQMRRAITSGCPDWLA